MIDYTPPMLNTKCFCPTFKIEVRFRLQSTDPPLGWHSSHVILGTICDFFGLEPSDRGLRHVLVLPVGRLWVSTGNVGGGGGSEPVRGFQMDHACFQEINLKLEQASTGKKRDHFDGFNWSLDPITIRTDGL